MIRKIDLYEHKDMFDDVTFIKQYLRDLIMIKSIGSQI